MTSRVGHLIAWVCHHTTPRRTHLIRTTAADRREALAAVLRSLEGHAP